MISSEGEQAWCASLGEPRNGVQSNRTTHDGGKTGKEVFNCYQKQCFLSQLWLPDAGATTSFVGGLRGADVRVRQIMKN